jgi:hypothetical protein
MHTVAAGLWGILYYKEIEGRTAVMLFGVSVVVILGGASLDGVYG